MDADALHLLKVIGWAIRSRRMSHDSRLTLQQLADATGISVGYLSGIERARSQPSIEKLVRICKALDVDIAYLFSVPTREAYRSHLSHDEALARCAKEETTNAG